MRDGADQPDAVAIHLTAGIAEIHRTAPDFPCAILQLTQEFRTEQLAVLQRPTILLRIDAFLFETQRNCLVGTFGKRLGQRGSQACQVGTDTNVGMSAGHIDLRLPFAAALQVVP